MSACRSVDGIRVFDRERARKEEDGTGHGPADDNDGGGDKCPEYVGYGSADAGEWSVGLTEQQPPDKPDEGEVNRERDHQCP